MNEYEEQAAAFLAKHGLKVRATFKGDKCPAWSGNDGRRTGFECLKCDSVHGDQYRVTIWRTGGGGRFAFDFWGSLNDRKSGKAPTAYDVLACIGADVFCPDTFEEFCGEYGYNEDSRKALSLFKRCAAFADRLRAFFTEAELEDLAEIQ